MVVMRKLQAWKFLTATSLRIRANTCMCMTSSEWQPFHRSRACPSHTRQEIRGAGDKMMLQCSTSFCLFNRTRVRSSFSAMAATNSSDRLAGRLFGPGDEGANWWDDKCVFHPIVVREPPWRMYYYGRGDDRWGGTRPALLSTGRIGMALSEDGVHWNRHRGPLPHGALLDPDDDEHAFDSVHVGCSDVFFHNGEWWMYYFGGSTEEMELKPGSKPLQGFRMRPGLVKSSDGISFKRSFTNPLLNVGDSGDWDELFVAWPRVLPPSIRHDWLMTYSAIERQIPPFSSIGAAVSNDGLEWKKLGRVLTRGSPSSWDDAGVGRRHVLVIDHQYVMFYEGVNVVGVHGIGVAVSSDGIEWRKEEDGPVFSARVGEDAWDNGTVAAPHVVAMADGSFRLYYVGSNHSKTASAMGLAVSDRRDFRSWSRVDLSRLQDL